MRILIAAVVALWALTLFAQTSETIEVSIVNVDVFVTDKQGNRVRGLTKDDFIIREGGRVQPITNFTEYSPIEGEAIGVDSAEEPAQEVASAAPPARRTIVLFIESFILPEHSTREMFDSMRKVLREMVRPGDAVSIVSWGGATRVRLELTDDLDAIEATLAKIQKESNGIDVHSAHALFERQQADMRAVWEAETAALASSRGIQAAPGGFAIDYSALDRAKLELFGIRQKAAAVDALIQSISGLEGRKIVIMATRRFGVYAGLEFFKGKVPDMVKHDLHTHDIRAALARSANANNVTIYPMYPTGLAWTTADASGRREDLWTVDSDEDRKSFIFDNEVLMNETTSLQELAEATGGALAYGAREVAQLLPRIGDDLESYYSLAYRTPNERKDRSNAIVVATKNPDYVVRARKQYVEKSDATKMRDRVLAGLFRDLEGSAIPLSAQFGEMKKDSSKRWTVPLAIRIPIEPLMTLAESGGVRRGAFSVYVAAGGEFGVISDVVQRTQPFTIREEDLDRAHASHFTYDFELKVDPFTDRVSFGVLDETSKEFGLAVIDLPTR